MTSPTLFFSRAKLFRLGLASALFGFSMLPLAYRMTGDEGFHQLHEAIIFYGFGRNGPRGFVLICGLLFALGGVVMLARVAGDRAAATIRVDGIRVAGLLSTRLIPWRHLVAIGLIETRWKGKVQRSLAIKSGRLPGESWPSYYFGRSFYLPVGRLDATPAEIAAWVQAARAAHARALLHPAVPAARPVSFPGRGHI